MDQNDKAKAGQRYRIVRRSGTWENGEFSVQRKSAHWDSWIEESRHTSLVTAQAAISALENLR